MVFLAIPKKDKQINSDQIKRCPISKGHQWILSLGTTHKQGAVKQWFRAIIKIIRNSVKQIIH